MLGKPREFTGFDATLLGVSCGKMGFSTLENTIFPWKIGIYS
jgi:hypothetical protein